MGSKRVGSKPKVAKRLKRRVAARPVKKVLASEELRRARAETADALAREAATAEILKVIASSPTDVQPVFDAIAQSALRLCGAVFTVVYRYDKKQLHIAADGQVNPKASRVLRSMYPVTPRREHIAGRAVLDGKTMHSADIQSDRRFPGMRASRNPFLKLVSYRTSLVVPLLHGGSAVGAIAAARLDARPFTQKEIRLLQTFAGQAVIAIENVRLFNETKEALERQTATAEILKVIASSPSDVQPVFEAIVKRAMQDRKSTRLNSSHIQKSRMPSSA